MPDQAIFISSCSRRQLARRRSSRGVVRLQLASLQVLLALLVLVAAFGAFVAGRGGL
jgi:hypothetical protein